MCSHHSNKLYQKSFSVTLFSMPTVSLQAHPCLCRARREKLVGNSDPQVTRLERKYPCEQIQYQWDFAFHFIEFDWINLSGKLNL